MKLQIKNGIIILITSLIGASAMASGDSMAQDYYHDYEPLHELYLDVDSEQVRDKEEQEECLNARAETTQKEIMSWESGDARDF